MAPISSSEGVDEPGPRSTTGDAGPTDRLLTVEGILDAARQRDLDADARDRVAVERDRAADLEAFTTPDVDNGYGADLPARRHAAQDRSDAKGDRTSAADDRAALCGVAQDVGTAGVEQEQEPPPTPS